MTTTIATGDFTNLRKRHHRSTFYLSVLSPVTLWSARVNVGDAERGMYAIPFDGGSGLNFTAIQGNQVVWVGTSIGEKDVGVLRVRSATSGDSGVTGTLNVGWHPYTIGDGAYLTFVHDYPIQAKYPWVGLDGLMGSTEVFYKDIFDAYTDQTQSDKIKPVAVLDIEPRAGFIRDGELIYWVDASRSYPMGPGASISTYALSIYPNSGTTITFDTATGIGYVRVTDLTQSYYWITVVVTDDNSNARTFRHCVFAHDPDASAGNYPIKDMAIGQYSDDWESGGITSQVTLQAQLTDLLTNSDKDSVDIIDAATCCLWRENVTGDKFVSDRFTPTVRSGDHLFVAPDISVEVTTSATCDVDTTFHAGIRIDNAVPADATVVALKVQVNAETAIDVNGTVTNGIVTATYNWAGLLAGCSDGTLKWLMGTDVIASTELWPGKIYNGETIYPSKFLSYPTNLLMGYIRDNEVQQDTETDTGSHEYTLQTPEAILKNNYMFTIQWDSRSSQSHWSHFHSQMTTAAAAMAVLDFHSTALDVVNVVGLDKDTDLRPYGTFETASLYAMADGIIRNTGIRAHFKCNRNGDMHMVYDVQLLTDDERDVLPIVTDVDKQDRAGQLAIQDRPEPHVALVYGDGIYWGGGFINNPGHDTHGTVGDDEVDGYCCAAPWWLPGYGGGEAVSSLQLQTVRSQDHLNEVAGRRYGQLNNPYPTFRWAWRGDFLDVLNMDYEEFWRITIQTVDNKKSLVFPNQKIILRNIELTIEASSGTLLVNTTWEPEVDAYPGVPALCPEVDLDLGGLPPPDWNEWPSFLPGTIVTSSQEYYAY